MPKTLKNELAIKPDTIKIKDLIGGYKDISIGIPEFQREYVWKENKVLCLIDSIYNKFPIGTLLIWVPPVSSTIKARRNKEVDTSEWIIDGQQRTHSLVDAFDGTIQILFNPIVEKFILSRPKFEKDTAYCRLEDIFNDNKYIDIKKEIVEANYAQRIDIEINLEKCRNLKEADIPVVYMKNHLLKDAVEVFKRINTSGTRLSSGDIESAQLSFKQAGFIKRRVYKTLTHLRKASFDRIYPSHLFSACNTILKSAPSDNNPTIFNIEPEKLEIAWNKLDEGINWLMDLLKNDLKISDMNMLWSGAMLMPIVVLAAKLKPSLLEKGKIIQWLLISAIKQRYSRSTLSVMRSDLKLCLYNDPINKLISEIKRSYSLEITEKDLKGSYTERAIILSLYIATIHNAGKDLLTGAVIDSSNFSKVNYHHIFPKSRFSEDKTHTSNVIGNIAIISARANNELLDNNPENYLPILKEARRKSQMIPDDKSLWKQTSYQRFIKVRTNYICMSINDFIKSKFKD